MPDPVERLMIGLVISASWGGALALTSMPLTWTPLLCVTMPTALWVTWPAAVEEWRRLRG